MKKIKETILEFLCAIFFVFPLTASVSATLQVSATDDPPVLDGKLDEPLWQTAAQFTAFKTFNPDYRKDPSQKTIVYFTYDEENIYFAFRCSDTDPEKIKATVSKRDTLQGDTWTYANREQDD